MLWCQGAELSTRAFGALKYGVSPLSWFCLGRKICTHGGGRQPCEPTLISKGKACVGTCCVNVHEWVCTYVRICTSMRMCENILTNMWMRICVNVCKLMCTCIMCTSMGMCVSYMWMCISDFIMCVYKCMNKMNLWMSLYVCDYCVRGTCMNMLNMCKSVY